MNENSQSEGNQNNSNSNYPKTNERITTILLLQDG